jgi:uncharacterized protein
MKLTEANSQNPIENTGLFYPPHIVVILSVLSVIAVFGLQLIITPFALLLTSAVIPQGSEASANMADAIAIAAIISFSVGSLILYTFSWLKRQNAWQLFAFRKPKLFPVLIWTAMYLILLLIIYLALPLLETETDFVKKMILNSHFPVLLILGIVILGPLYEELLCRGFLFKGIQNSRFGNAGAVIFTAAFFALLHLFQYDYLYLTIIFVAGLILGMARLKSGSIWLPLILHSLHNLISIIYISEFLSS